jgi:hypothetical protein
MMVQMRMTALMLLGIALGSLPVAALAQAAPTPKGMHMSTPAGASVVEGGIRSIHAGVITLISGTSVFITKGTKFPNGHPTLVSQIRVTGTRVAQGNIDAKKIEIIR